MVRQLDAMDGVSQEQLSLNRLGSPKEVVYALGRICQCRGICTRHAQRTN